MWKNKFFKDYFCELDNHYMNRLNATILKEDNMPPYLYKYTKAKYGLKTLKNNLIKMSNLDELNDINEGKIVYNSDDLFNCKNNDIAKVFIETSDFNLSISDKKNIISCENPLDELTKILYNKYNINKDYDDFRIFMFETYNEFLKNYVKEFNNNLKRKNCVVSLSEDNKNEVMWAHYADDFKGVCIEYKLNNKNSTKFNKKDKDNLFKEDIFLNEFCFPIEYVNDSDFTEDLRFLYNINKNKLRLLEEPLLKKTKKWEYEKEWRIIINKCRFRDISKEFNLSNLFKKNKLGCCFIKLPKPNAIYLGLKIKEKHEINIINICNKKDIPIYKMKESNNSYNINFEKIN